MANIILLAGSWCGGWVWGDIAQQLRAKGHIVFAPSLSGLDPDHAVTHPINLDTHIEDVLKVIAENQLDEVTLVGHSYAGMVITGVADRSSVKIKHLLYLDAQVPEPGQREWDLILEQDKPGFLALCEDGLNISVPPPMQFDDRLRPHPLATKLQPLDYDQGKFDGLVKTYVFAEKWFNDPAQESAMKPIFERVKTQPGWTTIALPVDHMWVIFEPGDLDRLIDECAS